MIIPGLEGIDVCRPQILLILNEWTSSLTGEICEIQFFFKSSMSFEFQYHLSASADRSS
jgi:hypothetical protein